MAYAAVTCLRSTIRRFQTSCHVSVASSTRTHVVRAYEELGSLQGVLEESGGHIGLNALEGDITAAVQKLEDLLELHELNSLGGSTSSGEAQLVDGIKDSVEKLKLMKEKYIQHEDDGDEEEEAEEEEEEENHEEEEEEEEEEENHDEEEEEKENMVGLADRFEEIKASLLNNKDDYLFSIIGMAGIGKTALARRLYQDPSISKRFHHCAFIEVGQNYDLQTILDQLNPYTDDDLGSFLDKTRHLIVLDDVWDLDLWYNHFEHRVGAHNRSRILMTTRLEGIVVTVEQASYFYMPFLNKEESWELLRTRVFRDEECPQELEDAGMEIADKCEGLPLLLVTVASILSEGGVFTPQYWLEVARKQNTVFKDAYDRILGVLYPSYNNLTTETKACFLYMAAFPPGHHIRRSRLVDLWCTEGFLEPASSASGCFDSLNLDHIVVPAPHLSSDGQDYQACSLHSAFRHLCRKELANNRLLHIIEDDYSHEGDEEEANGRGRRRIAVYHNVLLSIKDVQSSIGMSRAARSLLCTGPYHQYPVTTDFGLRLVRVFDVVTIRFYEFPMQVLELVQLRYFSITCNKNIPGRISELWKLEYLIVHQHSSIKTTLSESYVPEEIWLLRQLKHLQLIGRNLPNPPTNADLPNLIKLLDVGPSSCNEGVLSSIPNLQKLRVQIHLTPNDSVQPLTNLSTLSGLVSLQCVIVNPVLTSVVAKPNSLSFPPSSIQKLTLSGLGYPWKYLNKFMDLPHLRVLKLLCHAFRGEEWLVPKKGFLELQCLLIEDNEIVRWRSGKGSFPVLSHLKLSSCYKLKKFPNLSSLVQIEVVDCSPAAVRCAKKSDCYVTTSWDDAESDRLNYISKIYSTTTSDHR